jgi:hypothetical protein
MATKKQVEEAIFEREGFRVELEPFEAKKSALPAYEWSVMAPQRWKISDWKNARLEAYRLAVKGITVYRGDGSPVSRDMQLGNLRDSYYEAEYGPVRDSSASESEDEEPAKVIELAKRRKKSSRTHARRD